MRWCMRCMGWRKSRWRWQRGVKYAPFRTVQCSESLLSPLQGGRETAALQKASKRDFRHYNNRALTVPFSQGAKQESASYNNNPKGGFAPIKKRKPQKIIRTYYFYYMWYLPYNITLKEFSRQLRNHSTLGEILLWKRLRAGGIMKYSFNRQKPSTVILLTSTANR